MSFAEYSAIIAGAKNRQRHAHNDLMQAAWLTAKLTAFAPDKAGKFIKLERVLAEAEATPTRSPRQTWQQQMAIIEKW